MREKRGGDLERAHPPTYFYVHEIMVFFRLHEKKYRRITTFTSHKVDTAKIESRLRFQPVRLDYFYGRTNPFLLYTAHTITLQYFSDRNWQYEI